MVRNREDARWSRERVLARPEVFCHQFPNCRFCLRCFRSEISMKRVPFMCTADDCSGCSINSSNSIQHFVVNFIRERRRKTDPRDYCCILFGDLLLFFFGWLFCFVLSRMFFRKFSVAVFNGKRQCRRQRTGNVLIIIFMLLPTACSDFSQSA